MIGLGLVRSEIPAEGIDNRPRLEELGATLKVLESKIGVERVSRLPEGWDTADLAEAAARKLLADSQTQPADVECLFLVTQNPDGRGLPHTSALLHDRLGLPEACAVLDLSLGCSGFVYGLELVRAFMEAQGLRRGLLVTADPYSKVLDEKDRDTALIFGDAAAAALLTDEPTWRVLGSDFGSRGASHGALQVADTGKLEMNGRGVFEFSATVVPGSVHRALARAGLELGDIDRFLLHQGSRFVVEKIASRLGVSDRAAFTATHYGNTVSSSVPILLERDVLPEDQRLVLCGFGVGLSWATTVLERVRI